MADIKVDFGGLKRTHADLEKARTALDELILSLPEGASDSEALSEFRNRAEDLRNTIVRYQNLLKGDSENLHKAALSFADKDSAMAKQYDSGISKSLRGSSQGGGGVR